MLRDFGVRGRLLLAFLGVSGFAILAAAAGMHSFLKVGEALDGITRDRVPSAVALLQLAAQAERIVAASPALVAVRSRAEHDAVSARIEGEARRLSGLVRELETGSIQAAALDRLAALVDGLKRNLETLGGLVSTRLELSERKARSLRKLADTNGAVQRLLGPATKLLDARRAQLEQSDRCRRPEPAVGHQNGPFGAGGDPVSATAACLCRGVWRSTTGFCARPPPTRKPTCRCWPSRSADRSRRCAASRALSSARSARLCASWWSSSPV